MRKGSRKKRSVEYRTLRSELILRGYTFRSFATKYKHNVQTVYSAAKNRRSGVVSVNIRRQLEAIINTPLEEFSHAEA